MKTSRRRAGLFAWMRLVFLGATLLWPAVALSQFPGGGGGFGGGPSIPSPGPTRPSPGPSRPSPGPSRPSPYNPGRNPTYPQPGRHQPGYRSTPNQPSDGFNFGRNQHQPSAPTSPYQPTFGQRSDPASMRFNRVYTSPSMPTTQPWQRAQTMMQQGNYDAGREMIDAQLRADRSLQNVMGAVHMLEQTGASRSMMQPYRNEALEMARRQMQQNVGQPLPWVTVAKFSLEDNNDAEFRRASAQLYERFPEDKHAQYFHGVAAIKDGDWQQAEASLRKAQELGMPAESINDLLRLAIDEQRWIWEFAQIAAIVVVVWAVGLLLIYVVGNVLSWSVLRSLRRRGMEAASGQHRMRSLYRTVVNLAGLYYYISLPIVVLLSIAVPLSIAYGLLMLPDVSMLLILVVGVMGLGGLLTALSGLRACFVRWNHGELPGRAMSREEAPRLWALAEEVASTVGTRAVDEIRLLPGTEIAVTEQGSYLKRMRDRGQRVLFLGAGLLEGFKLNAFRSVLAHEYGHFLHRDTAGGDIALRVQAAMGNFGDAIMARGKIRWWDIAVHFLRLYHYLFRRLSFGASRLQEVLSDRVAVLAYGPAALNEGLEHVIRRSFVFEQTANKALSLCLRGQPVGANFYTAGETGDIDDWQEVEEAFRQAYDQPSTLDDTHPSPAERHKLAQQLEAKDPPATDQTAWELFPDRQLALAHVRKEMDDALAEEARFIRMAGEAQLQWVNQYVREARDPQGYLHRAQIYLELGKFEKALADLRSVPSGSPLATEANIGKVMVHRAMEDYGGEAQAIQELIGDRGHGLPPFDLHYRLGRCHMKLNNAHAAMDAFSAALNEQNDSVAALVCRGHAHLLAGNYVLAEGDFGAALEHSPHCAEAQRGIEQAQLGEADGDLTPTGNGDEGTAQSHHPEPGIAFKS